MSLHRYGYVRNNPVNGWDYYGFWKMVAKNGQLVAISEDGDNLWTLAEKLTGNGNNYEAIAEENGISKKEAGSIRIGQEFKIPSVTDSLTFMNERLNEQYLTDNLNEYNPVNSTVKLRTDQEVCPFGSVEVYQEHYYCSNDNTVNCWGTAIYIAKLIEGGEPKYVGSNAEDEKYKNNPDRILINNKFNKKTEEPKFGDIGRYSFQIGTTIKINGADYKITDPQMCQNKVGEYGYITQEDGYDCLTHYVNFLIEGNDGKKYVFSKSGAGGIYEVGTDEEIGNKNNYGDITGYYTNKDK
jgi:hypothetical protein